MRRSAAVTRKTKETEVHVTLDLDGAGRAAPATGIGFFDHMLEALARHALYDLQVRATGDLHVDQHHTVEDVGIVLGQALSQALGERRGIRRYGDATVPLDDALARVVVDVSGRPYLAYHADPPTWQKLGDYDVALTPEFFRALATHGGLTLHVDLLRGQNAHHVVEAVFKAAARALGEATPRRNRSERGDHGRGQERPPGARHLPRAPALPREQRGGARRSGARPLARAGGALPDRAACAARRLGARPAHCGRQGPRGPCGGV